MKLHAPKFALASALSLCIVHFIRGVFFMYWPEQALTLSANMLHIGNTSRLQRLVDLSWEPFLASITHLFVFVFLTTLLLATLYNLFIGEDALK